MPRNRLPRVTLNLLTTAIVAIPSNASKWQMGFNSAFKGLNTIPQMAEGIMADLWRDFWIRETGTGQQVAQLHDRYDDDEIISVMNNSLDLERIKNVDALD